MLPDAKEPVFEPARRLDYELELGVLVGRGNRDGVPLAMQQAEDDWFGLVLLNDWSARDIQAWEYQPLGPFLSKSFATSVSPWIVTTHALAPFRVPAATRAPGVPPPLPYLTHEADAARGAVDLTLEVWLQSEQMRAAGLAPVRLSQALFREMFWTIGQLVAHHASNGCNLRPGDLLASGTVSGAAEDARGCLLELAWRAASHPARGRDARFPPRRRRGGVQGLVRGARRAAHRIRGVPRPCPAGCKLVGS
jgi:fumarylacetoacetase